MDYFNSFLRCSLYTFVGLIVFNPLKVNAQNFTHPDRGSAYASCLQIVNAFSGPIPGMNPPNIGCPNQATTQCGNIMSASASSGIVTVNIAGSTAFRSSNTFDNTCIGSLGLPANVGLTNAEFNSWLNSVSTTYFSVSTSGLGNITFRAQDFQCNQRPSTTNLRHPGPNGTGTVCDLGCQLVIAASANTTTGIVTWEGEYNNLTCDTSQFPAPQSYDPNAPMDIDGDGTPDTTDPCPEDIYNECDGTNDPQNPNAPQNSAGGGISCDSPPVCNGDGIACATLYQSWAIRCNPDRYNGDGETSFNDENIVNNLQDLRGDLETTNQLLTDIKNNTSNTGNGDGGTVNVDNSQVVSELQGVRSDLESIFGGDSSYDPNSVKTNINIGPSQLDSSGWGMPRGCPAFQNIQILNQTIDLTPLNTYFCNFLNIFGALALAFSSFFAIRILLST